MISKEDFNKVWKDSTREDILNQFYWEHIAIRKAIEYIQNENNITKHGIYPNYTYEVDTKDLLNILQNGSDK